ncbi:hypothetical protein LEP1GSC041_1714 [Leptospira noguchii str. 2006001870]|nr:hypothetical protein LEP1GSC041_1714 [Leptospira noguchii str. 2006001870]EMO30383.1 hypothetical protein LEP1GSC170_2656 [Leptospira interrogans serovar Bataviae str. HAI135]
MRLRIHNVTKSVGTTIKLRFCSKTFVLHELELKRIVKNVSST